MTLQEFQNKYLGKQVEFHSFGGGALNQCVDLVNQYIKEVLGLTPIIGTNAKDFGTKYNKNEFTWIANTTEAIIEAYDIPVWNGNVGGGAGHIAIATKKGTQNSFSSLDQNWSKAERVTLEQHNYNNVIGWLRPKGGGIVANMYKGYDLANPESMKVAVDILVRVQAGEFVEKSKYDVLEREAVELRKRPASCPPGQVDPKDKEARDIVERIKKF